MRKENMFAYGNVLLAQGGLYIWLLSYLFQQFDRRKEGFKVVEYSYFSVVNGLIIGIAIFALAIIIIYFSLNNKGNNIRRLLFIPMVLLFPVSVPGIVALTLLGNSDITFSEIGEGFIEYFWSKYHGFIFSIVFFGGLILTIILTTICISIIPYYPATYLPNQVDKYTVEILDLTYEDSIIYSYDESDMLSSITINFPVFNEDSEIFYLFIDNQLVCTSKKVQTVSYFDCEITNMDILRSIDSETRIEVLDEENIVLQALMRKSK